MKHRYMTWHELEELVSKVVFKLDTPYDALLAITRGGIIPGGMIAEALKMKDVFSATVIVSEDPSQRTKLAWPRFQQFPEEKVLEGRKVLVVDNLWLNGRTALAVKGRIETAGGYPEVAVLHWKQNSRYSSDNEPDYYGEETKDFIHYPWQRIDDSDYRVLAHPVMPS